MDRFISNIVLSCLLRGTNDLGNRETNEEQRKITRRRRKRKSKERIERGNIDEIRYLFLSFLERIFEAPSFVRKRLVVTDRVWAFSDDNRCVLNEYATNYR